MAWNDPYDFKPVPLQRGQVKFPDDAPSISTLSRWARDAGIDVVQLATDKTARARQVLEAVTAEKRADLAAGLLADAQRLRTQLFAPVVEKRAMAIAVGGDMGQEIEVAEVPLDRPTPTDQVKIMTAVAIAVDKIQNKGKINRRIRLVLLNP